MLFAWLIPTWYCRSGEAKTALSGFDSTIKPFFQTYCYDCHGHDTDEGEITLSKLSGELTASNDLEQWAEVLERLKSVEMPPEEMPQPSENERRAVVDWIEAGLRRSLARGDSVATAPRVRRLTNVEYQNTLNELLGFELDVLDELPKDPEQFYHFNNTPELMRMGPEQLDRYFDVGRFAMASAIVDASQQPTVFRQRREWSAVGVNRGMGQDEVGVWGNSRNTAAQGMGFRNPPQHGEFRLRIQAAAILPPGYREAPLEIQLGIPRGRTELPYKIVGTLHLTNSPDNPQVFEFRGRIENHPSSESLDARSGLPIQEMSLRPELIFDDGTLNDGGTYAANRQLALPRAIVNWMELEVPVIDLWPPKHHTDILFESPLKQANSETYVRMVLERFMSRAYRRPATATEIDRFLEVFRLVRPSVATFEEAARETLAMVLVSPQFLCHNEADPATDAHFAMASRLSYFLWASMPDEELLRLASARKLDDPTVIEKQVLRMLSDKRSNAFVEDFTRQWLSIRKMLTVPINHDLFPRFLYVVPNGETAGTEVPYRPSVRDYMMQETIGFVGELIRRNENVLSVVDSDFAYLNERLAAHYGVEGVQGERMRVVALRPEHKLGGLFTHGSVLIGNGTGTAPHPIYRAVWLREAILGDEVAPPPAEVPALNDTAGESLEQAVSIAELLARHRTEKSCNNCHARLDPWGVAFERYNAIGRYQPKVPPNGIRVSRFDEDRHKDLVGYQKYLDSINTVEVSASTKLPNGPEVTTLAELKAYLIAHRSDDIRKNMVSRLLSYGLGRELTVRDRFDVEELCQQAKANGSGMRDMIVSICQSEIFKDSTSKRGE